MDNESVVTIIQLADDAAGVLLFFPTEDGKGRIVPLDSVRSIIPDFKRGGSMIFLRESDKAVSVPQTPNDIAIDLLDQAD
jgi:hypothetical protein